jgi:hypothetical protein
VLGGPGSGKSTLLRYIAWTLALRLLNGTALSTPWPGWEDERTLPVLLSASVLQQCVERHGPTAVAVFEAALDSLTAYSYDRALARDLLGAALERGAVLILLDHFDRLPAVGPEEDFRARASLGAALQMFGGQNPMTRIIIACRPDGPDAELPVRLAFHSEVIAPFSHGQVRHFVSRWCALASESGQTQEAEEANQLADALLKHEHLRSLAGNPQLLTWIVHLRSRGLDLPRDRALLYGQLISWLTRTGQRVPSCAKPVFGMYRTTRHIVQSRSGLEVLMRHRAEAAWRELILLCAGVAEELDPTFIARILQRLVGNVEEGGLKPDERRFRDLILAAELGADRGWPHLKAHSAEVVAIQSSLRLGLVSLLADVNHTLPVAERVGAGFLLGALGDPRVPNTLAEWQRELQRAIDDDVSGYFCFIGAVGGVSHWIARYPITNSQWETWVSAGGPPSYYAGLHELRRPNQPVVGLSWDACVAFCAWLSGQLGARIRLPDGEEWQAAASGGDGRLYPWGEEWRVDRAATLDGRTERSWATSVPVGCYPAGAAPCGALDLAGNVWEWVGGAGQDDDRELFGGSYISPAKDVHCSARMRRHHSTGYNDTSGLRVLLELAT